MKIMDYVGKDIDYATFNKLINDARKEDRNQWYAFCGYVEGKSVSLKGIGTWLQRFLVNDLYQPGPMDISVKEFNQILAKPFTNNTTN